MFSGISGAGAQDAWYGRSIDIEECLLTRAPFDGAGVDLWKCFDRIRRHIMMVLVLLAGFPVKLAIAYMRFVEHLRFRNTLAATLATGSVSGCGTSASGMSCPVFWP